MKTKKEREYSEQFKSAPFSYLKKKQVKNVKASDGKTWSDKCTRNQAKKLDKGQLAEYIAYLRRNEAQEETVVADNRLQGKDGKYHYTPLGRRYYARLLWRKRALKIYISIYTSIYGGSGLFRRNMV